MRWLEGRLAGQDLDAEMDKAPTRIPARGEARQEAGETVNATDKSDRYVAALEEIVKLAGDMWVSLHIEEFGDIASIGEQALGYIPAREDTPDANPAAA